jgi:enoyl-CoA hydratase/carnithine racemase
MEYQSMYTERRGAIGVLTLNNPDKLNAFAGSFVDDLRLAVTELAADDEVRAVVLKANGRAFCAGGNLDDLNSGSAASVRNGARALGQTIRDITLMDKPWIAAVQGAAAGGGANLALACDFVIASENARFGQAFINIGITPDTGGLWVLANKVGYTRAKELAMTGRLANAQEALEYGMALKVVPLEEMETEAFAFAETLASKPPIAIGYIKAIANRLPEMSFAAYAELEAVMVGLAIKTADSEEGIAAFLEKRKPQFKGE